MTTALHRVHGHEALRQAVATAHGSRGLPATLLLHGLRGVGKQRLALWTAQLVLCEAPGTAGPCDACRSCRLALRIEHPDLHWYFPLPRPSGTGSPEKLAEALEAARGEALAVFRSRPLHPSWSDEPRAIYLAAAHALRRRAQRRPTEGAVQVFIVADAETLVSQEASPEAANALLKLLEEPPQGTRFVLTSSEPGRLLPTIRSRSLPLQVTALPRERVAAFLSEVAGVASREAARAARLSQGSIGRALGFLPDEEGEPGPLERVRSESLALLEAALARDAAAGFQRALAQRPWGARGLVELLDSLEEWLRDLAAVWTGAEDRVLHADRLDRLRPLSARADLGPTALERSAGAVEQARLDARGNVNPQLLVAGLVTALRQALLPTPAGAAP